MIKTIERLRKTGQSDVEILNNIQELHYTVIVREGAIKEVMKLAERGIKPKEQAEIYVDAIFDWYRDYAFFWENVVRQMKTKPIEEAVLIAEKIMNGEEIE